MDRAVDCVGMAPSPLSFRDAHPPGTCDVAYCTSSTGDVHLVTCGADGKLCFRAPLHPGEVVSTAEEVGPLTCVVAQPSGGKVVVADTKFVKVWTPPRHACVGLCVHGHVYVCVLGCMHVLRGALILSTAPDVGPSPPLESQLRATPSGEEASVLTRFVLPPRALALSPSGVTLAAGGDDEGVKLIALSTARVLRVLPSPAYTRGLAYDAEGTYVAAASADGTLSIWDMSNGKQAVQLKRAGPKVGKPGEGVVVRGVGGRRAIAGPGTDGGCALSSHA